MPVRKGYKKNKQKKYILKGTYSSHLSRRERTGREFKRKADFEKNVKLKIHNDSYRKLESIAICRLLVDSKKFCSLI